MNSGKLALSWCPYCELAAATTLQLGRLRVQPDGLQKYEFLFPTPDAEFARQYPATVKSQATGWRDIHEGRCVHQSYLPACRRVMGADQKDKFRRAQNQVGEPNADLPRTSGFFQDNEVPGGPDGCRCRCWGK